MKRKILNAILFIAFVVILSIPNSCGRCKHCIMTDITGTVIGQTDLCGDELDDALANPDNYTCE